MKRMMAVMAMIAVLCCIPPEACATGEYGINSEELYARVAIISGFESECDLVYLADIAGNTWAMYGIEDWSIGDVVCIILWNAGTDLIMDDEIVSATYNGRTWETIELFDLVLYGRS